MTAFALIVNGKKKKPKQTKGKMMSEQAVSDAVIVVSRWSCYDCRNDTKELTFQDIDGRWFCSDCVNEREQQQLKDQLAEAELPAVITAMRTTSYDVAMIVTLLGRVGTEPTLENVMDMIYVMADNDLSEDHMASDVLFVDADTGLEIDV